MDTTNVRREPGPGRVAGGQAPSLHAGQPPTAEDHFHRYYRELEACGPAERLTRLEGMVQALQAGFTLDSVRKAVPQANQLQIKEVLAGALTAVRLGRYPIQPAPPGP